MDDGVFFQDEQSRDSKDALSGSTGIQPIEREDERQRSPLKDGDCHDMEHMLRGRKMTKSQKDARRQRTRKPSCWQLQGAPEKTRCKGWETPDEMGEQR